MISTSAKIRFTLVDIASLQIIHVIHAEFTEFYLRKRWVNAENVTVRCTIKVRRKFREQHLALPPVFYGKISTRVPIWTTL
jgi:hypothetical protein